MAEVQMPNGGLLSGLAEGVKQGLITYQTMKGIQHNQKMEELSAGVQKNPLTGELEHSPEKQAQMKLQAEKTNREIELLDPSSPASQHYSETASALAGTKVPQGMSGSDLKEFLPVLQKKMANENLIRAIGAKQAGGGQLKLSKGEEAADRAFGKEYEEYIAGGGYAGVQKNLEAAKNAIGLMKSGEAETGGISGLLPKGVRDVVNPNMTRAQEALEQSVQASLRQTLGAQFTEREGQQILQRTFNPRLSTEENIRRAEAVVADLEKRLQAKQAAAEHYESSGSLKGFKGTEMVKAGSDSDAKLKRLQELRRKAAGG